MNDNHAEASGFNFTDRRRIDPETGEPRPASPFPEGGTHSASPATGGRARSGSPVEEGEARLETQNQTQGADPLAAAVNDALSAVDVESPELLAAVTAERDAHLDALQRERASFTNYRNRTVRDLENARGLGVEAVLTGLLPVLDDIERARNAGELAGPMAAIATKLDEALTKFGVERYGAVGEDFDPNIHDALMHRTVEDAKAETIEMVIDPGYRIGERIARAARVGTVGPN